MRRLAGLCAILPLALVVAGCGGTTSTGTGGAGIVPASAPAYIAINTDPDSSQWQTVDDLVKRFPSQGKARKVFHQALNQAGVSWENDIKPALGKEFDFIWLDFRNDGQDFVALTQPKNEAKFEELFSKDETSDFFHMKFRGWQVMAPSQELLDRFRRESDSGDSLADKGSFKDAMDAYPSDMLLRAWVDGAAVMKEARKDPDPEFQKILPKLGSLDWVAVNLRVTSDGIRFDANVHGTPGPAFKGIKVTRPFRPSLQNVIPKDALLYTAFHGRPGMLTGLEKNALFKDVPELHRYSKLLAHIESIVQGENALYVRAAGSGKIPEITFVAEPAPGTNSMKTLDGILNRYRTQLELPSLPKAVQVAGLPARQLKNPPVTIYYANVGKRFVITDFPSGIRTLKGAPPASLGQSSEYRSALDSSGMPSQPQGFLYVNFHGGIKYAQRLAGTPIPGEVKRNLNPLRSAVEYAATRPSEIQITLFIRIK